MWSYSSVCHVLYVMYLRMCLSVDKIHRRHHVFKKPNLLVSFLTFCLIALCPFCQTLCGDISMFPDVRNYFGGSIVTLTNVRLKLQYATIGLFHDSHIDKKSQVNTRVINKMY